MTANLDRYRPVTARTIFRAHSPKTNNAAIRIHGSALINSGQSRYALRYSPTAFHRATGSVRYASSAY